jgi:hypothetical protein
MLAACRRLRAERRWNHLSGIIAALTASCFICSTCAWAQNPCSLISGGATPTSGDISAARQMAAGSTPCTANIEGPNVCTVITVQRVINASSGQPCSVYSAHAAALTWTASTTPNVTYNVYRATASTGPFTTPMNASPITGTTYTDTTVQAGQTYYYVVTAVISSGQESAYSSPASGTIPSP